MRTTETGSIVIHKRALAAILSHASTDEMRPNICSVRFVFRADGSATLQATDGHRGISADAPTCPAGAASCGNYDMTIPAGQLARALKACSGEITITPQESGGIALADERGFSVTIAALDAVFPPLDNVIPHENTLGPPVGAFNAHYLAEAARACGAFADSKSPAVRIRQEGGEKLSPAVVDLAVKPYGDHTVRVVVMPMHV